MEVTTDTLLPTQTSSKKAHRFRDKVMACWLGKAVGGTLGLPFEGVEGPLDLSFYDPVPTELLPNDDLDLQVLWACVMDQLTEPRVDRDVLAQAWLDHVAFPWDEYGVAIRNLRQGIRAPVSGSFDNWFVDGMGAAIRTELWACLAPGNPRLAAAYAYEDACVDHDGEGIWAAIFLASLESAAFVESDPDVLLDGALKTIPDDSRVRKAIEDTRQWWIQLGEWRVVREEILSKYDNENFTDVTMNLAFIVLGWLAGEGDFGRSICIAANCGKDTDCTAATLGSLLGILNPDGITDRWLAPIGRQLVLSPGITGITPPATLDTFTDLVLQLGRRLDLRPPVVNRAPVPMPKFGIKAFWGMGPFIWFEQAHKEEELPLEPTVLEGTMTTLPLNRFHDQVLAVRYPFTLAQASSVRVMFNTAARCRVWVNKQFAFERAAGGTVVPSFHRAPEHQFVDLTLSAGSHELLALIERPSSGASVQWIAGIGDGPSKQWLANAFQRVPLDVSPPDQSNS